MKALILAAGKGLRLRPLTLERPKPLIKVAGKPLLYFIMKNLHEAGFSDVGIVVGYKKEMVEGFLDTMGSYGLDAELIEQKEQMGTGHAIKTAEQWVGGENFLALMGDNLYSPSDLSALNKADKFCHVAGYEHDNPERFGVLVQNNGFLERIVEKPKSFVGSFINTALYKFTPDIFDSLRHIKKSERGEYEITDAITELCRNNKVRTVRINDYWLDLGSEADIKTITDFIRSRGIG